MINLTLNDYTQKMILPHLEITEKLMSIAISKLSNKSCQANIYAMPDLGMPFNLARIHGGFFTGMFATWECDVPFIPVDATINICGVSIYEINQKFDYAEFLAKVENSINNSINSNYIWNYSDGNHFIIVGKSRQGKLYLIIHGSAKENKDPISPKCLYPFKNNWYYDDIKVEHGFQNRYIRYISGDTAIKFYGIVKELFRTNSERNDYFAEQILRDSIGKKVFYKEHYGMPTHNTLSVGCQWDDESSVLLTSPGNLIYLLKPFKGQKNDIFFNKNNYVLFPHGLGVKSNSELNINFSNNDVEINGTKHSDNSSLIYNREFEIRTHHDSDATFSKTISDTLSICNADIIEEIIPIYSYSKFGYKNFELE